jgi:hypothetical protein
VLAAKDAVQLAYSTEQVSERAASDAVYERLRSGEAAADSGHSWPVRDTGSVPS